MVLVFGGQLQLLFISTDPASPTFVFPPFFGCDIVAEGSIESDADHILIQRDLIPTICIFSFSHRKINPLKG